MRIGQESRLFNAEIRARREALGLNQEELALKLGYTKGTVVSQAESLRITSPRAPIIKKLARFFNVPPEVLCPPWLVMMDGLPKRNVKIARITKNLLEQKVAERLLAIDTSATEKPLDVDKDLLIQTVRNAVPKLTPIERDVVCLYFGLDGEGERSPKEISKIVKRKAVSGILHRATKKLREYKEVSKDLKYFYDSSTRQKSDFRLVLGEPDGKTSFYLPEKQD